MLIQFPLVRFPTDFCFQPIDPREVAERVYNMIQAGPSGELMNLGGEVCTSGEPGRVWMDLQGPPAVVDSPSFTGSGCPPGIQERLQHYP